MLRAHTSWSPLSRSQTSPQPTHTSADAGGRRCPAAPTPRVSLLHVGSSSLAAGWECHHLHPRSHTLWKQHQKASAGFPDSCVEAERLWDRAAVTWERCCRLSLLCGSVQRIPKPAQRFQKAGLSANTLLIVSPRRSQSRRASVTASWELLRPPKAPLQERERPAACSESHGRKEVTRNLSLQQDPATAAATHDQLAPGLLLHVNNRCSTASS